MEDSVTAEPVRAAPGGGSLAVARPVCGAQLRGKPGRTCGRAPVKGSHRCKLHGGTQPRGADSPNFRHGLYSKALPTHLRDEYEALVNDPKILESRQEVALLQLRLRELTRRVGTNESREAWAKISEAVAETKAALGADDPDLMVVRRHVERLDAIVMGAVTGDGAWDDLTTAIDRATKIASREWRRTVENQQVATIEQVRLIVHSIADAVQTHVHDPAARLAIAQHVAKLGLADL